MCAPPPRVVRSTTGTCELNEIDKDHRVEEAHAEDILGALGDGGIRRGKRKGERRGERKGKEEGNEGSETTHESSANNA